MAFSNFCLKSALGLILLTSTPAVALGQETYDEVKLRCEGTYREDGIPPGGHDFEMSIMTRDSDGEISIMLVGAIGRLGWFFLDENGNSSSYRYIMTAKNEMLSGWADDSKVPGLEISNLNLDRTTGDLWIHSSRDEGESSFRGVCEAIRNRF